MQPLAGTYPAFVSQHVIAFGRTEQRPKPAKFVPSRPVWLAPSEQETKGLHASGRKPRARGLRTPITSDKGASHVGSEHQPRRPHRTPNLTRPPELRVLPSGASVCNLRVAVNVRRRNAAGEWGEEPNFFDVVVYGAHGETVAKYMHKGRPVALDGRLEWREWETNDDRKAQAVRIIARTAAQQRMSAGVLVERQAGEDLDPLDSG